MIDVLFLFLCCDKGNERSNINYNVYFEKLNIKIKFFLRIVKFYIYFMGSISNNI